MKPILKFLVGFCIIIATTVGAYYLGKEFCSYVFEFEAKELPDIILIWFAGIFLQAFICIFLFVAYSIGDKLLD
jgi:hypothetical protein